MSETETLEPHTGHTRSQTKARLTVVKVIEEEAATLRQQQPEGPEAQSLSGANVVGCVQSNKKDAA